MSDFGRDQNQWIGKTVGHRNCVNVDRHTPMLLPPDLRDWVREDDLMHFIREVVRYLTADTHPDHDTIRTFRRRHRSAHSALLAT